MKNLTPDPQQVINSTFDSVNLINSIITKLVNEENKSTVTRNVQHLEIMMSKDEFKETLNEQQLIDINNCISNGNLYTAEPIIEDIETEEV